jgi:RNA polymerase primary sigma factor
MCVAAAKNWATTDTLMDYVNEANFGLAEAIDRFDPAKGFKFSSYAMWYIKRALEIYHHNIKPIIYRTNNSKVWSVVSKQSSDFVQSNERNPTTEELMDLVNDKIKKGIKDKGDLMELNVTMVDDYSLDEDSTANRNDIMDYNRVSASVNTYEDDSESEFNKRLVSSLLDILTPREQKVIKMRFGLMEVNGIQREFELNEVAEELNLTSERIRQMENVILDKLKKEYEKRVFHSL